MITIVLGARGKGPKASGTRHSCFGTNFHFECIRLPGTVTGMRVVSPTAWTGPFDAATGDIIRSGVELCLLSIELRLTMSFRPMRQGAT